MARDRDRDRDRDRRKGGKDDRRRAPKKKVSILTQDNIDWIDYKDVNLLRRFMSERAKIRARRVTGNNAQQQREVARAIRVAREMALLPYSVRQVTQRSRGGRGRDRDRADLSAPMPTPDAPPPVVGEGEELDAGLLDGGAGENGLDADAGVDEGVGEEAAVGAAEAGDASEEPGA
jgi:small subunit ribosomal protein S18